MKNKGLIILLAFLLCGPSQAQQLGGSPGKRLVSVAGYLISDGDSLSTTAGSSDGKTVSDYTGLPANIVSVVVGVGGATTTGMVAAFATHVTARYTTAVAVAGSSVPFVVHFIIGANDITLGTPFATSYANIQTYINNVHALGSNAKVIIATVPLECNIFGNGTWLTLLQAYNNSIYANWNVPQASGGLGADGLDDWFAEPTVGMNTYASSAFCSSTYSPDGLHLNDFGKAFLGPLEGAAAAKLL
jgi:GDSL-like lipase/acylhydrolase family protein